MNILFYYWRFNLSYIGFIGNKRDVIIHWQEGSTNMVRDHNILPHLDGEGHKILSYSVGGGDTKSILWSMFQEYISISHIQFCLLRGDHLFMKEGHR